MGALEDDALTRLVDRLESAVVQVQIGASAVKHRNGTQFARQIAAGLNPEVDPGLWGKLFPGIG